MPKAKDKVTGEVKVYSQIGSKRNSYDMSEYINATQFDALFSAVESSEADSITVSINSPGGSVSDADGMIATMKKSKKDVTAVIDGFAASNGYFICLGAKKILAAKNAKIMVHSISGTISGHAADLRAEADIIDKHDEAMATLLAERLDKTVEEVMAAYFDGADHWFTAQEALDAGLIDGITDYDAEVKDIEVSALSYGEFFALATEPEKPSTLQAVTKAIGSIFKKQKATPKVAVMLCEEDENLLNWSLYDLRNAWTSMDGIADTALTPELRDAALTIQKQIGAGILSLSAMLYNSNDEADLIAKVDTLTERMGGLRMEQIAGEAIKTIDLDSRVAEWKGKAETATNNYQALDLKNKETETKLTDAMAKLAARPDGGADKTLGPGAGKLTEKKALDYGHEKWADDQLKKMGIKTK